MMKRWMLLLPSIIVLAIVAWFGWPKLFPPRPTTPPITAVGDKEDPLTRQIQASIQDLFKEMQESNDPRPTPKAREKIKELATLGPRARAAEPLLQAWLARLHSAKLHQSPEFKELAQALLAVEPMSPTNAVRSLDDVDDNQSCYAFQLCAFSKSSVAPIAERLQGDALQNPDFGAAALNRWPPLLAQFGPDALPAVRSALTHEAPAVRRQALRTLALMGPQTAGPALPEVEAALRDKDASVRTFSALLWIDLGRKDQAPPMALVELLKDADPLVRLAAARTLSQHPEFDRKLLVPVLAPLLAGEALADTWYNVEGGGSGVGEYVAWKGGVRYTPLFWEETAAHVLLGLGPVHQIPAEKLVDLLKACPHDGRHLVTMLAAQGETPGALAPVIPALVKMVQDKDSRQRRKALVALGQLGTPLAADAVPDVLKALDHEDGRTRWQAFLALMQLDPAAARQRFAPALHPAITAAASTVQRNELSKVHDWTRCLWHTSAAVLVPVTNPRAEADAKGLFRTPTDWDVDGEKIRVDNMLHELEKTGPFGKDAVPLLSALWQGTARHPVTRVLQGQPALALLAREGAAAAPEVPHLIAALNYYDESSRPHLYHALGKIGEPAVPYLAKVLEDPEQRVLHMKVMEAFHALGPKAKPAIPLLLKLLAGPEDELAEKAALTFASLGAGGADAVPALRKLLQSPDVNVRRLAADALGGIGPEARAALPDLIALFKDDSQQLRLVAVRAVSRLGKDAVEALKPALTESNEKVRLSAVEALTRMLDEARPALEALRLVARDDTSAAVREAARTLVERLEKK
jgi:HEAT repeat protein